MTVERITVVLDSEEAAALHAAARADLRRPHEQARFLLRLALFDNKGLAGATPAISKDNKNGAAHLPQPSAP